MGLSLYEIKKILYPKKEVTISDDFRVIDSWAEYDEKAKDVNERPLEYLCYELEQMNPDTGEKTHYYKAIRFARVIRLPKSAKQSLSFMEMHSQVLSGVYEQGYNLITIIANVIEPVALGLLFLYGVQETGHTLDEAKAKAKQAYIGFTSMMQGTYRVLEMRCVNAQETEWLREKMYSMDYLSVLRGIPKAGQGGEDAGNKGMGGRNLNPDSQGTLEEIISGMADYEYVIQVLSTPVYMSTLKDWALKTKRDMTNWNSQLQGTKAFSLSLSVPMMFMSNQSSSQGWSKGYTDANSVSFSQGESFNQGYGENVGQALSNSYGQAFGESRGISESVGVSETQSVSQSHSISNTQSYSENIGISQGIGQNSSFGTNIGQSQNLGFSSGTNEGISQGMSMNQSQGMNVGSSFGESQGESLNSSHGINTSLGHSLGRSESANAGTSETVGATTGTTMGATNGISNGQNVGTNYSVSNSHSQNSGWSFNSTNSEGQSHGTSGNLSQSNGGSLADGDSSSDGGSKGYSLTVVGQGYNGNDTHTDTDSLTITITDNSGTGVGKNDSFNASYSESNGISGGSSDGVSVSGGQSAGISQSISQSSSLSQSASNSYSTGASLGQGMSASESFSNSTGESISESFGANHGISTSQSIGQSVSQSWGDSLGKSASVSESQSVGLGTSFGNSSSNGTSFSISNTKSQGFSYGNSESFGVSNSYGVSNSHSVGNTYSQSVTDSYSQGQTDSYGQSKSVSTGNSISNGTGISQSETLGSSGAYMQGSSSSMGLGPSIGYNKSYQWKDQQVEDILKLLTYQNDRLELALRGCGAFYTYVYIACPDQDALSAAKALAKSTWQNDGAIVNPVQVLDLHEEEQKHLLYHFTAFSSDMAREYFAGSYEYKYATVLLPNEFAAYTHLPRISEGGVFSDVNDVPKFSVPSMLKGEIYMGTILSAERYTMKNGYRTPYDYRIDEAELMHGFFTGASRSGKTVAAMRFVAELSHVRRKDTGKRLRIICMDPKQDWRTLARFVEPERFRFHSLGNMNFRPIKINPFKIPKGVYPQYWIDGIIDIYCRAYGLLERGKQMMAETIYELYDEAKVFEACQKDDWKETVPELSKEVNFVNVYKRMEKHKLELEDPNSKKGKAGNDTRDAYARLLDRLQAFSEGRYFAIEQRLFGTSEGIAIDELIGDDDITVLESKGLESTFRNFIFGVITSGFYKYALAHEGGYKSESQYETVLIIEEANEVLTGNDCAGTGGGASFGMTGQSEFEQILDQAAGYGLYIMAITQKIADMPKSIIANSGLIFAGRLKTPDDITVVVRAIGREERMDDRDVAKWFPRSPTGWFICQSSRTFDFKEAEPIMVQIARLNIAPPTNAEIDEMMAHKEALRQMKIREEKRAKRRAKKNHDAA